MEKNSKNNKFLLSLARDNLLNISENIKNKKFNNLITHEVGRSKLFKDDNLNKFKKFNKYKRGSIIFVHFGINTNQEFSNSHFAIVLDKNDNPKKGTLTVVPLTSKNKNGNISIEKEIFSNLISSTETELNDIKKHLEMIQLVEQYEIVNNFKNDGFYHIEENTLEHKKWMKFYNRHDPKQKYVPVSNIKIKEWINEDLEKIKFLKEKYSNYNKISYAKIDSIVTISKLKISKPLNNLDPIGKICISTESMHKLEQAIASKLLSGRWRNIDN